MNKAELLAKRQAALAAVDAITEGAKASERDLTDDETAKIDAKLDESETLKASIEKIEADEKRAARLSAAQAFAASASPELTEPVDPTPAADLSNPNVVADEGTRPFATFGEQLMCVANAAFNPHDIDPRLKYQAAISGSGTTSGPDGGFLAQQDFSDEILKRTYETGSILPRVKKIPLSPGKDGIKINAVDETSRANGSRWGGVRVYRVEQGGQGTSAAPTMRQIALNLKKLMGLWYVTDEMLSDAVAMEAIGKDAFAEEFAFKIEDELIRGVGASGEMLGILESDCLVSVAKESNQAADTIVKENIDKMWSRCWARSRLNAVWYINQCCEPQLHSMTQDVGTGGVPVYLPPGGLSASPYGQLYGRPVIPIEQCEAVGTVGDIFLADFSQYVMIDEGSVKEARSIHLRFDYGEQVFRWTMRNDGQPIWASALTPFKGGSDNTLSPFVALASRD